MELMNIRIIPSSYQLNFGLNSSISCTVDIYVTDFNGNPVSNYAISIDCPDDSSQTTQTGTTNANGICTFNYTFSDTNGTGYQRFIVNNVISDSIFLYRDTGWVKQALTYKSGYSDLNSGNEVTAGASHGVKMRIIDKTVELRGIFNNSSALTTRQDGYGTNVATMTYPQFAPSNAVMVMLSRGLDKYFLELNPSGNLWIGRHGTNTTNKQIPANSWIRCYLKYTI